MSLEPLFNTNLKQNETFNNWIPIHKAFNGKKYIDAFWAYIIELCSQTDWDIYESVPHWQLVQWYLIWIVHFVFCREIDILMPGYTHLQVGDSLILDF